MEIKNNLNPENIKMHLNITKFSYCIAINNAFTVFKSINNIIYIIYSDDLLSIISYNLIKNKIINEIKNAHDKFISNIRYYLDINNKRDLILSISAFDNNIKLWNIHNYECLINIKDINKKGYLYSACLLNDNNLINIVTSNYYSKKSNAESIKIYDLKANKIKEINNSDDNTFLIDIYYDNKYSKNYIITANIDCVKSYDYQQNKIYHKYYDNDSKSHSCFVINNKDEIIELIESCIDGNIRIWDFHSGELLNKINVNNECLYGICLWNKEYLFVGCKDKTIKLISLSKKIIIKKLKTNNPVITIKKITYHKDREYLVSQEIGGKINLWINEN